MSRASATDLERDIYANYLFEKFLEIFLSKGKNTVLQFSIGAEPLPFETGSKLKTDTVFEIAEIISHYTQINFNFHIASEHQNQAFCTLARELPNVSFSGYWWHNFFPGSIRNVLRQRLDMVAANKQIGFISDAYCMDWTYAKSILIRRQMAEVFAEKVEQGQYTIYSALKIANQILYETPKQIFNIKVD